MILSILITLANIYSIVQLSNKNVSGWIIKMIVSLFIWVQAILAYSKHSNTLDSFLLINMPIYILSYVYGYRKWINDEKQNKRRV